jgi:hypothetical protein
MTPRLRALAALLPTLGLSAALYWPSLDFGFIWDDPLWFQRVVGRQLFELLAPQPTFQFYRPLTLALMAAFARADGTFDPLALHAWQLALHLLNIALTYGLARALGSRRPVAAIAALLFALFPLAHQVVTWAAAIASSSVTACLLGSAWLYIAWRAPDGRRHTERLIGALVLYALALGLQESAVPYAAVWVLLELYLVRQGRVARPSPAVALFALLAAGYTGLWLSVPRAGALTTPTFDPEVAVYLGQGVVYPLLGRPAGWDEPLPGWGIAAVSLAGVAWLLAAAVRSGQGGRALLALAWYVAALLPGWAGLNREYVQLASRLFYPSAFGAVLLWAGLLEAPLRRSPVRAAPAAAVSLLRAWRPLAAVLLGAVVLQGALLIDGFNAMLAFGTRQLDALVAWSAAYGEPGAALFVNYPDRYAPRRPPYPSGYWGVTLAPVAVELGAFPGIRIGRAPATISRSMPPVDADARGQSAYVFDLRGIAAGPTELYADARSAGAVLLMRYAAGGQPGLVELGRVLPEQPGGRPLARFGRALELRAAELRTGRDGWTLLLRWRCLGGGRAEDTVAVHLGESSVPPLVQADGDLLGGLVPLRVCQGGDEIEERRFLPLPPEPLPEGVRVRIAVYNRASGERLPAIDGDGKPLPDGLVEVR